MARRRVTSVDVATESGVSQATVARVFSSPELVAPPTRAKVMHAAERLGYVPNAIARSLKSQRTNIIGAVVPANGEYWQNVLAAFSRSLARQGEQLLLFSFDDPEDAGAALAAVQQYRLDGLIVASASIRQQELNRVQRTGLPVVAFNQPAAAGVLPSVYLDNEAGMRAIARHLADQGCRTVQFVGGVAAASTDQSRYRGAAQELGSLGIACPYLEAGAFTYDAGYKVGSQLAQAANLPDAVMVSSDEVAFGVFDGLQTAGLRVPRDLLLSGFDGLPQASWAGFDLTTLVQPIDVLVDKAVDLLLVARDGERLSGGAGRGGPPEIVVPGELRVGATTQRTLGDRTLGDRTLGDRTLGDRTLGDR